MPAAPCDAAILLAAAQQAFGPLPEGAAATDPRCVETWATAVLTAPGQDNALAVFENPEGEWMGAEPRHRPGLLQRRRAARLLRPSRLRPLGGLTGPDQRSTSRARSPHLALTSPPCALTRRLHRSRRAPCPAPKLWFQIVLMAAFYGIYSYTRNLFGSALVDEGQPPEHAFTNAMRVIDAERFLHIFHEATIQSWFLGSDALHPVLEHLLRHVPLRRDARRPSSGCTVRAPARFTQWRNVLAFTTGLAILGFSLFPLMPPRLLDDGPPYGGAALAEQHEVGPFGFHDTLAEVGGLWSFDSGTVAKISNQYAAMPSLHIGWSTWCTCALWPLVRRRGPASCWCSTRWPRCSASS